MNNSFLFDAYIAKTSQKALAIEISKAEDVFLYTPEGKRYYDLISGISVSNAGHRNPEVENAVIEQVKFFTHLMVYGEIIQSSQVKYAEYLVSLLPKELDNVFFVNSGSEAIEGAMKLAKRFTGRSEIIACKNAYHGSTQGALSVMGNENMKRAFRPLLPDIKFIEFNNDSAIFEITEKTACVLVEPIQGEAGIILPKADYLKKLKNRCVETGSLLIFDEVQTGIMRTGKNFAFEHYNAVPDVLVLAKALGGGFPLGAFISSKKIMETLSFAPPLGHITTFGGHPVSCAAGLAAFQFLQKHLSCDEIERKGQLFYSLLKNEKHVKDIRYKGLLMAVELENSELLHKFIDKAVEKGILTDWFLFNDKSFRISPPLTITETQIYEVCDIIKDCLNDI